MTRIAVSLLLTPSRQSSEVYLVERNPQLAFFGGFWAFPGGTLDPEDAGLRVENLVQPEDVGSEDYAAFLAAAARELFEETGVWVARGAARPGEESLREYRTKLLDGEINFREILQKENQHLDASDFTSVCRITTPPFSPRRYDTWFLRCEVPQGTGPEIWPGELLQGRFLSASQALDLWRRGEMLIVPPVIHMLKELELRDCDSFLPQARELTQAYARGKLLQLHVTCGVILAPLKTRTRPPAQYTNAYVVGDRELYLIDPGAQDPAEQDKLFELLDELIAGGRRLKGLLLTHHHPDHVGGVAACLGRYGIPLYAHDLTASLLPQFTFDGFLQHGQELDLGASPDGREGWKLRVHHVPGHAPGHLAFQETRYQALMVGDMISTISSILIDPQDGDMAGYVASLEYLESICEGVVYPGHGPATLEGVSALHSAIVHRRHRERQLLEALDIRPQSIDALLAKVYRDVDAALLALARRSLESGLNKLLREGRVKGSAFEGFSK